MTLRTLIISLIPGTLLGAMVLVCGGLIDRGCPSEPNPRGMIEGGLGAVSWGGWVGNPARTQALFTALTPLFEAIAFVESGGNNNAVGDNGASRGAYQISRAYWQEACEEGRVDWDYDRWVWSKPRSELIMCWYWKRYGAKTDEGRARIHNGGPKGMFRQSTKNYWIKIKSYMNAPGEHNEMVFAM